MNSNPYYFIAIINDLMIKYMKSRYIIIENLIQKLKRKLIKKDGKDHR